MTELVQLTEAQRALAVVETAADAKALYDKIEALSQYAKRYRLDNEKQNEIAEAKLRTARKGGALIPAQFPHGGDARFRDGTLVDAGLTKQQSHRWQALASISDIDFEEHLATVKASAEELTLAGALALAQGPREPRTAPPAPPLPTDVFNVLYADPPWRYEHAPTKSRAIENQYPTLALEEIKALGHDLPAADDSVLFMWATSPKLSESIEVIDAWGFSYRTCMVWVKDKIGMGYYCRQQHELLLVATRGKPGVPAEASLRSSVINAPRGRHSEKPALFYELIEGLYPGFAYLELFARNGRSGWSSWGNEVAA